MEFLLFDEVLKNLIFFPITYQKSWLYNTNIKQIKVLNANLWLIYSKIFEFMIYIFICAFLKIKFFLLLRPSTSSGDLKKDPTFGFLTFEYALKN